MRMHVPLSTALYNRLALRHHPLETARCLGNLEGWRAEGGVGVDGGRRSKMNFWSVDAGESNASDIECVTITSTWSTSWKSSTKRLFCETKKLLRFQAFPSLNFQIWMCQINSWKEQIFEKKWDEILKSSFSWPFFGLVVLCTWWKTVTNRPTSR